MLDGLRTSSFTKALELEIERLIATIEFRNQCFDAAQQTYADLIKTFEPLLTQGEVEHLHTWLRRSDFFFKDQTSRGIFLSVGD